MLLYLYCSILFPYLIVAYPNYAQLKTLVENRLYNKVRRFSDTYSLPNSDLIGMGYDPVQGSPVCFTGACQMDGFKQSVFDLKYTSSKPGSCLNLSVPDNVQLLCLPGAELNADTEEISSITHLQETTLKRIDVSVNPTGWGRLFGLFASYGSSIQTTYMSDLILEKNLSLFYTAAEIGFVKLTMFEPKMELSDNFRFVIDNMPCCDSDSDVNDYITSYIFDYFGFAFISELILGGVIQEIVSIDSERLSDLKTRGLQTEHSVSAGFFVKTGIDYKTNDTITIQEEFRRTVTSTKISQLGGDPAKMSEPIVNWIKTIPDNPAVIHLKIKFLSDLITSRRFPNDTNIAAKVTLINHALDDYIVSLKAKFCTRNCSGKERGTCEFGDLMVPVCKCQPQYTGVDCSMDMPPDVLRGLSCGFVSEDKLHISCDGMDPRYGCPMGYSSVCFDDGIFKYGKVCTCSKDKTDKKKGKVGTICGIHQYCGGRHIINEGCPYGYLFHENSILCYKEEEFIDDLPGIACGYGSPIVACGDDSSRECPIGYEVTRRSSGQLYYCLKQE